MNRSEQDGRVHGAMPLREVHDSWVAGLREESRVPAADSESLEEVVDVKAAAAFLGVSRSLVYAYVERKQIPHFRMMGRSIRFRLSELAEWRQQFHVMEESK